MPSSTLTPARVYAKGIGDAVADRTINRKITRVVPLYHKIIELPRRDDISLDAEVDAWCKTNGFIIDGYNVPYGDDLIVKCVINVVGEVRTETWEDVAERVARGSASLVPTGRGNSPDSEFNAMNHHLRQASILMSGRHLQHGDENQASRPMEVFTNCSTSAASFLTFYLLLNGSGVGRAYDDDMMVVDFNYLPVVVSVIDSMHPDVQSGEINAPDRRTAEHLYAGRTVHEFVVPDSREGWAKAIEKMELMAFRRTYRDDVLLLDFSKVRHRGSPIGGMQNRPASGPGPIMTAIKNMTLLRDAGMAPWRAAMYADHYLAECVLVGGARRAARMATKSWKDKTVLDFISVKRGGFLWTSNNSVTVDEEFWKLVKADDEALMYENKETRLLANHAKCVFEAICEAAYHDGTGEPGLINQDKLTQNDEGVEVLFDGNFAESERYKLDEETLELTKTLVAAWRAAGCKMITNPCGEISIIALGAYCVIADVVPYHAGSRDGNGFDQVTNGEWDNDAEDAFRVATRALIRTNLMNCLYSKEVTRTNRIGVGITGLHEYAWARFDYGWKDIVDEEKSKNFWLTLARFKRAVQDEAKIYSTAIGVCVPHTNTTIKPAGTTSKLFGLTEGAHLPSMRKYLRWVQFRNDDPLIGEYSERGYPVKKLKTYSGTTIVGFPTKPTICDLGMGDKLVTAAEATPEEQYQYLRLLEKYWIGGVEEDGVTPLEERGNQVSYTLKYKPEVVSFEEFKRTLLDGQSSVRCCSVMPQGDTSAYEYQPEQPVTKHEFEMIAHAIELATSPNAPQTHEDIGFEHVDCGSGACPVSWNENSAAA
jgi:adenosylcobalamin-dependent ribonucleoside-triphosphate reductase